ncbi:MAG: hypothetical protein AAB493_02430 [Patescibacteria group bacterium]
MKTLDFVQVDTLINTTKKNSEISRLESVALGLLVLAKKSDLFKKRLMQRLFEHDLILPDTVEISEVPLEYEHIKWIPLINPKVAERKLVWLSNEIDYAPDLQRQRIIKILSLTYRKPVPKMAAWGIFFNETLGLTLGDPDFYCCLEYSQVIILGSGWHKSEPQNLTKQVSMVSLMALTRCIEEAHFNLNRLEPEVSSWLLEGSGIQLYSAKNDQDFEEILVHARDCGLPFASISEDVNLIALQPSITGSYDTLLAKLTSL